VRLEDILTHGVPHFGKSGVNIYLRRPFYTLQHWLFA